MPIIDNVESVSHFWFVLIEVASTVPAVVVYFKMNQDGYCLLGNRKHCSFHWANTVT
jgi:hypothetical protein